MEKLRVVNEKSVLSVKLTRQNSLLNKNGHKKDPLIQIEPIGVFIYNICYMSRENVFLHNAH